MKPNATLLQVVPPKTKGVLLIDNYYYYNYYYNWYQMYIYLYTIA